MAIRGLLESYPHFNLLHLRFIKCVVTYLLLSLKKKLLFLQTPSMEKLPI